MKQRKSKQTTRILVLEPDEQVASAITSALEQAAPDALVELTFSVTLFTMAIAFTLLFVTLHLAAMRNELLKRRVRTLQMMQASRPAR